MAELVDAPDSKSGVLADVSVRLRLLVGNYPREGIFFLVFNGLLFTFKRSKRYNTPNKKGCNHENDAAL